MGLLNGSIPAIRTLVPELVGSSRVAAGLGYLSGTEYRNSKSISDFTECPTYFDFRMKECNKRKLSHRAISFPIVPRPEERPCRG